MSDRRSRAPQAGLALVLVAVLAAIFAPELARADGEGLHIQVFALSGPACGGPVILGEECPDTLLPGADLVLQRLNRKQRAWVDVTTFTTNSRGYADLFVKRRGLYRVDAPREGTGGIRPAPLPFFLGPVKFRVPAYHESADGLRLTPVVVHFDSGIR